MHANKVKLYGRKKLFCNCPFAARGRRFLHLPRTYGATNGNSAEKERCMDGIVFDLDGTLLDSMGIWRGAGVVYLKKLGIEAQPDMAAKILTMTSLGAAQYVKQLYSIDIPAEEIVRGINGVMEEAYFSYIQPKEGAVELLEELKKRGVPMTIATATDRYLVEGGLRRLNMDKYFMGIFTCSEVGVGKRDGADVYEAALRLMGARKAKSWVFEDSPHAARTAAAAGFNVAGVKDIGGGNDQDELKKYCKVYFESLLPTERVLENICKI